MKKTHRKLIGGCSVLILGLFISNTSYAVDGKAIYTKNCQLCHMSGVMGAPKFGDKKDWAPRVKQGMAVLVKHAIEGFKGKKGIMPPKGGKSELTDEEVKAAVKYMVSSVK